MKNNRHTSIGVWRERERGTKYPTSGWWLRPLRVRATAMTLGGMVMKIGKAIIEPSYSREPAYKTGDDKTLEYKWQCTRCHEQLAIRYSDIALGTRAFSESEIQELKDHFRIGYVGKSQDGGWPEFLKVPCPRCKTAFVVYAGVKEPANSFLLVTIQGIAELREEQDAQPTH